MFTQYGPLSLSDKNKPLNRPNPVHQVQGSNNMQQNVEPLSSLTARLQKARNQTWAQIKSSAESGTLAGSVVRPVTDKTPARDHLARILLTAGNDTALGDTLMANFEAAQDDPISPIYNPYAKPTNKGIFGALATLGVDTSAGVNEDFYTAVSGYKKFLVTNVDGTPMKGKTAESQAAYYLYKLASDEPQTIKAETEWAAMQQEATFWVNKGYSDLEVYNKVKNSDKYPTLRLMDEQKKLGAPLALNRGIGYSDDGIYGTIWAARNGGSSGDTMLDAVKYAMGEGKAYYPNAVSEAARTPGTDAYHPYLGVTNTDAQMRFGVDAVLDDNWLKANAGVLAGNDKAAKDAWNDVYLAEEDTKAAEKDLAKARQWIDARINAGWSYEQLFSGSDYAFKLDDYPTLKKMERYREQGGALELNRSVPFTMSYFKKEAEDKLKTKALAASKPPYQQGVGAYEPKPKAAPNYGKGNIDLNSRQVVINDDGSYSTVDSFSFWDDRENKEVLVPTVVDGKHVSEEEAQNHYYKTGEHLGKFDTWQEADAYAVQLHEDQATQYKAQAEAMMGDAAATGSETPAAEPAPVVQSTQLPAAEQAPAATVSKYDRLYAEQFGGQPFSWNSVAAVAAQLKQAGGKYADANMYAQLYGDIERVMGGEAPVTEAGKAWAAEYAGYIFGGETSRDLDPMRIGGDQSYDSRTQKIVPAINEFGWGLAETGLGSVASEALDLADKTYTDKDEKWKYAQLAGLITQDMDAAKAEGTSLNEYYEAHPEATEKFATVAAYAQAKQDKALEDDVAMQDRVFTETKSMLDDAYTAVKEGRNDHEQLLTVELLKTTDVSALKQGDPRFEEMHVQLTNAARMDGFMHAGARDAIVMAADDSLEFDLQWANALGLSLDEYYEYYPERNKDPQTRYAEAKTEFESVWKKYGDMSDPKTLGLAIQAVREKYNPDLAALEKDLGDNAGVGPWTTTRVGVDMGVNSNFMSMVQAYDFFVLSYDAEAAKQQARQLSTQDYRAKVTESVGHLKDKGAKDYWTKKIDETNNIYNLGYDLMGREGTSNYLYEKQKYLDHLSDFMAKNATPVEQGAAVALSAITNSAVSLAEATAATAVLGGGTAASLASNIAIFGAQDGAQLGVDLYNSGMSLSASKAWGALAAVVSGSMEYAMNGEYTPKIMGGRSGKITEYLTKRGANSLIARKAASMGKVADLVVSGFNRQLVKSGEEALQEGVQDAAMQGIGIVAHLTNGDFTGYDFSQTLYAAGMGALSSPLLYAQGRLVDAAGKQVVGFKPVSGQAKMDLAVALTYAEGCAPESGAYAVAQKIQAQRHAPTISNMVDLFNAIEKDMASPKIQAANLKFAMEQAVAAKTVEIASATPSVLTGVGPEVDAVNEAKANADAADQASAAAEENVNATAQQKEQALADYLAATDTGDEDAMTAAAAAMNAATEAAYQAERDWQTALDAAQAAQETSQQAQVTLEAAQSQVYAEAQQAAQEAVQAEMDEADVQDQQAQAQQAQAPLSLQEELQAAKDAMEQAAAYFKQGMVTFEDFKNAKTAYELAKANMDLSINMDAYAQADKAFGPMSEESLTAMFNVMKSQSDVAWAKGEPNPHIDANAAGNSPAMQELLNEYLIQMGGPGGSNFVPGAQDYKMMSAFAELSNGVPEDFVMKMSEGYTGTGVPVFNAMKNKLASDKAYEDAIGNGTATPELSLKAALGEAQYEYEKSKLQEQIAKKDYAIAYQAGDTAASDKYENQYLKYKAAKDFMAGQINSFQLQLSAMANQPITPAAPAVSAAAPASNGDPDTLSVKEIGPANKGGTGKMYEVMNNDTGEVMLFKPATTKDGSKQEKFRAYAQVVGYNVQAYVDPTSAVFVEAADMAGTFGAAQESISISGNNAKAMRQLQSDLINSPDMAFPKQFIKPLLREHVTDWLLGNFDSHGGNLLIDDNGKLRGIDKEQAFRYLMDDDSTYIQYDYHPNAKYGEMEPIYNTLFKKWRDGLAAVNPMDLVPYINRVEAVPESTWRAMVTPYAEALADQLNLGDTGTEDIINRIVARKNNLRKTYEQFFFSGKSTFAEEEIKAKQAAIAGEPAPEYNAPGVATIPVLPATAAPKLASTATKNFKKWFEGAHKLLRKPGTKYTPITFYHGGDVGFVKMLDYDPSANVGKLFLTDNKDEIAPTYAGGSKEQFKPWNVKSWEEAIAAVKDFGGGYTLAKSAGGYYLKINNSILEYFEDGQLAKFNVKAYDTLRKNGLMPVYVNMKNPLVIHGNSANWDSLKATVKDKDGNDYTKLQSTDSWVLWAYHNGYDGVIFDNIKDAHGGWEYKAASRVIVPMQASWQVKSIYNVGTWDATNSDFRFKAPSAGFNGGQNPTHPVTGDVMANPVQTMKSMLRQLEVGAYLGDGYMFKRPGAPNTKMLGYFATHFGYVAAGEKHAADIATTAHEAGHALGQITGLTGSAAMVSKLDPMFAQNYPANVLPEEAFAEFVMLYMSNPAEAENFAGTAFIQQFENALQKNKVAGIVKRATQELLTFKNADALDRGQAMQISKSNKNPYKYTLAEHLHDLGLSVIRRFADTTAPAGSVDNVAREASGDDAAKLRDAALAMNFAEKRADALLTSRLSDVNGRAVSLGLSEMLANAGLKGKEDFDLLNTYSLFWHAIDREVQKKTVFGNTISIDEMKASIRQIDKERPRIAAAHDALMTWWDTFMQTWMVDTHMLEQKDYDTMREMYPHYVPTMRLTGKGFKGMSKGNFTVKTAKGSDLPIIPPMDSMVEMVHSIVGTVLRTESLRVFDDMYHDPNYSLGMFAEPANLDTLTRTAPIKSLLEMSSEALGSEDGTTGSTDVLNSALQAYMGQAGFGSGFTKSGSNDIVFKARDGSFRRYKFADQGLFELLSGANPNNLRDGLESVGKLTRMFTKLTTGSNPLFAFTNALRDFQKSVNYGSWASNYITGSLKWARAFKEVGAAYLGIGEETKDFKDYVALGGGGWTRYDYGSGMSAAEIRDKLAKGYEWETMPVVKAGKMLFNLVTAEKFNSIVETTSRYAEYKFGKADKSTDAGRQKAFRNAQEVTIDFSRVGANTQSLRRIIPFFNATVQSGYQAARMFSAAERSRLAPRLVKTLINNALMGALSVGLILKFGDDDEKEGYGMLPLAVKMENLILRTGNGGPFIRVPLAQDPLARIGYALGVGALDSNIVGGDNLFGFELAKFAQQTLSNMAPSGTILQAVTDVASNRTWWGGTLEPSRVSDAAAPEKYVDSTPTIFRQMSGALYQEGVEISPIKLQYLMQQYTGFFGQLVLPMLSINERTGGATGVAALRDIFSRRFTVDPMYTNDVGDAYYDGLQKLDSIIYSANRGITASDLRPGLTAEQAQAAVDEAQYLTRTDGALDTIQKEIKGLYDESKKVAKNAALSDEEVNRKQRELQTKIIQYQLQANEIIGGYREKYIDGKNLVTWLAEQSPVVREKTAYEALPDVFLADATKPYMQRAEAVWEANRGTSGENSLLPHPSFKFDYTAVKGMPATKVVVEPTLQDDFLSVYKLEYSAYIDGVGVEWDVLSNDERRSILEKAHNRARDAAKAWYIEKQKLNIPKP